MKEIELPNLEDLQMNCEIESNLVSCNHLKPTYSVRDSCDNNNNTSTTEITPGQLY